MLALVAVACGAGQPVPSSRPGAHEAAPAPSEAPSEASGNHARPAHTGASLAQTKGQGALAAPADGRLFDTVVPLAYELEVEIDPAEDGYRGRVAIEVRMDAPTRALWLHAEGLAIDAARLRPDGGGAAWPLSTLDGAAPGLLGLDLGEVVPPGRATLEITFRGELAERVAVFRQTVGKDAYVFTDFEPLDARRGFPCFDEPRFKTPWTISLVVPAHMHGLSNMPEASAAALPGGKRRLDFMTTRPLPSYLVAFAVGPFDMVEGPPGPVPIRVAAPRGMGAWAREALATAPPLLRIVRDYFGTPVPFPKIDFVSVPVFDGAMENPGLITVASRILLMDPERPSIAAQRLLALVLAHEFAHLWFGDLVTLTDWRDLWLNEGLATWLADKALLAWRPARMPHVDQVVAKLEAMDLDDEPGARAMRQPVRTREEIRATFDAITYKKGGALMAMFEGWLSDAVFRRAMRGYVAAHADGNATAEDLMAALEAASGQDLRGALASFLEQPGVPLLRAELSCAPEGASVLLAQERFLAAPASTPAAGPGAQPQPLWQVPVCLRYGAEQGASRRTCVLLREQRMRVTLPASGCPAWVMPNAGAGGYYRYHLPAEQLLALAQAPLGAREATELAHGLRVLAWRGDVPVADVLRAVQHLARHPGRHVAMAIIDLLEEVASHLLPPGQTRPLQAYVRALYRPRARALGFAGEPDEREEVTLLRPAVVGFVGHHGRDPWVIQAARQLTEQWLRTDRGIVPGMMAETVSLAAASGGAALFDRMERAMLEAVEARDETRIMVLLAGLGSFSAPALVDRALALALSGPLAIEQRYELLARVLGRAGVLPRALAFLAAKGQALTSGKTTRLLLLAPLFEAPLCSEPELEQARALAQAVTVRPEIRARAVDAAARAARACARFHAAQADGAAGFFR